MNRSAFTLIELLIVVAIIAILAAVGLPNFLEAQTRARIARAVADMRTIRTAIESYYCDNNVIPLDADDLPDYNPYDPLSYLAWEQQSRYRYLTTPIAYLTNVPIDPFNVTWRGEDMMTDMLFPGDPPYPYAYMTEGDYSTHAGQPKKYGLVSLGPNKVFDSAARGGIDDYYDPTNGTISRGDIVVQR